MMRDNLEALNRILNESSYTVALCGSGMLAEGGVVGIKIPDRAYEIEKKYKASPEELFTTAYYNARTDKFFEFYKNEILNAIPEPTESSYALASMERVGKLQCMITTNIFNLGQRGGCKNVINLYGSVYENKCPNCGKEYSLEFVKAAKKVPLCTECNAVIRPMVNLYGEMVDSQLMTRTMEEIEKAETLLLLGTTLRSRVFSSYIKCFNGKYLVIIHKEKHYEDYKADLAIFEEPKNVFTQLKEKMEEEERQKEKVREQEALEDEGELPL